ncbi:NmrA family NAD(P)-binding protein [Mucilaginibacter sp.]|uniref:NmrA family NAD(P)-binding protein n=1 Tax=Mucilaginibacter sp. TaxID=1882438 RepID=UPI00284BF675|nr:NmrA family NAD(P)-binding protein [Mucilaginibacter sp.]MDR3694491.1 NAD(P)H-binding protein [Mucilaginibacter sp.]
MKKTIVVLGATGKVGGKIADILLNEGHYVKLIARSKDLEKRFNHPGAELMPGDITDPDLLTAAFRGADSAFILLPPNFTAPNYREFQREVGDAAIEAIKGSGIKYVVSLSSAGAQLHEGNGIIAGLAEQEVKLNQLKGVNILHLRAAYFMDNALLNINLIKNMNINGTTAAPDYKIPMTATKDVAAVAAKYLANLDFEGKVVRPVLGDRNYSFTEITGIIGRSIGKPDLQLVQFPADQSKAGMISLGISENVAEDIVNMETALQNGIMNYQQRTAENSSPTTAEVFAEEVFAPAYRIV